MRIEKAEFIEFVKEGYSKSIGGEILYMMDEAVSKVKKNDSTGHKLPGLDVTWKQLRGV